MPVVRGRLGTSAATQVMSLDVERTPECQIVENPALVTCLIAALQDVLFEPAKSARHHRPRHEDADRRLEDKRPELDPGLIHGRNRLVCGHLDEEGRVCTRVVGEWLPNKRAMGEILTPTPSQTPANRTKKKSATRTESSACLAPSMGEDGVSSRRTGRDSNRGADSEARRRARSFSREDRSGAFFPSPSAAQRITSVFSCRKDHRDGLRRVCGPAQAVRRVQRIRIKAQTAGSQTDGEISQDEWNK